MLNGVSCCPDLNLKIWSHKFKKENLHSVLNNYYHRKVLVYFNPCLEIVLQDNFCFNRESNMTLADAF